MPELIVLPKSELEKTVKRVFSGYRGRRPIRVSICDKVGISDYWDGGSRTYVTFVDKNFNHIKVDYERQTAANPFKLNIGVADLRKDVIAVENCIFCGKDLGIRLKMNKETFDSFPKESFTNVW